MKHKPQLDIRNLEIDDIAIAMNNHSYEMEWYLDLEGQATVFIMEFGEDEDEIKEKIMEDEEQERFIPIPWIPSHQGWEMMEDFILSREDLDDTTQNLLLNAIQGRGAFYRFKDAVHRVGVEQEWYEYKERADSREALDWLYSENLIREEDIETGMQMVEDRIDRRKRRVENIAKMKKGVKVICSDNHGHAGHITPGNVYQVQDEQPENKNIRLENDNGRLKWYPKAHFELLG